MTPPSPRPPSRQWICLPLAAAALALAAGCGVDQKREVDAYRQQLDARVPAGGAFAPDDPLTLQRALALANQNNEQLGLRGEDYVQALIQKNRVVANFLPTVSFQPSFTIEQRPRGEGSTGTGPGGTGIGQGGTGGGTGGGGTGTGTGSTNAGGFVGGGGFQFVGQTAQRFEAPVVGNINLYRGGADVANLRSAEANIERQRLLLLDAQSTVLLNVAQVYYQVLRSARSAEVLASTLRLQEARLRDVEEQFRNGLAIRLSVAQTRAQVNGTRAGLIQAESDVRNARSTLALLLGVPAVRGPLELTAVAPPPDQRPPETDFEALALTHREDLGAAAAAVRSARAAVDVAVAQYYPSVSLNVSGFLYREFYADASKWNAILSANLPIFSAGLIEADVRAAWSRLRQAALSESLVRRQVLNDVRVAYENLVTADRRLREFEEQAATSREALEQARNAFANNLAINLDVLVAQDQLLNSELLLTGAQFDRTIFYLDLVRATGRLTDVSVLPPTSAPTTAPTTTAPTTTPTTRP